MLASFLGEVSHWFLLNLAFSTAHMQLCDILLLCSSTSTVHKAVSFPQHLTRLASVWKVHFYSGDMHLLLCKLFNTVLCVEYQGSCVLGSLMRFSQTVILKYKVVSRGMKLQWTRPMLPATRRQGRVVDICRFCLTSIHSWFLSKNDLISSGESFILYSKLLCFGSHSSRIFQTFSVNVILSDFSATVRTQKSTSLWDVQFRERIQVHITPYYITLCI